MRILVLTMLAVLVAAPLASADNFGSTFGYMATARATGQGQTTIAGTVGFADNTAFVAGVTYGLTDKADGRIRVGLADYDGFDTALAVGGDMRWQLWNEDHMGTPSTGMKQKPFDMSLGGFFEWTSLDAQVQGTSLMSMSVFQIGAAMSGSHTIQFSNGGTLAPYGRVNLRYEHMNAELGGGTVFAVDVSDSHLAMGLNGGVAWGPSRNILLFGELQVDGNDGIFFGIDYSL
jgi:hypothetical protein